MESCESYTLYFYSWFQRQSKTAANDVRMYRKVEVEIGSWRCRVSLPLFAGCGFMGEQGSCKPWLNLWPSPLTQAIKARINSSLHWSINWIAFPTLAMAWPRRPAGLSNLLAVQIANALALTAPWIYVSTPETHHHKPPPSHQHPLDDLYAAKQSNKYALSNSLAFTRASKFTYIRICRSLLWCFYWCLKLEWG